MLFLDFETGGLDPLTDEILEVGAILASPDGTRILARLSARTKPAHPERISAQAQALNGFNADGWREALTLDDALARLLEIAPDAVLVGHNMSFDWGFLLAALQRRGLAWPGRPTYHDTLDADRVPVAGGLPNRKLTTLARAAGSSTDGAHAASVDAEMCRRVYVWATTLTGALPSHRLSSVAVHHPPARREQSGPLHLRTEERSRAAAPRPRWVGVALILWKVLAWTATVAVAIVMFILMMVIALSGSSKTRKRTHARARRRR